MCDRVTIDLPSFQRALAQKSEHDRLVLLPSHRSLLDFVLCSFLVFDRAELNIGIPHIAAAAEFGRIPLLGRLLGRAQAFFVTRGVSRQNLEAMATLHELVSNGETLEFFLEGTRSRTREFLRPQCGLLRRLAQTPHHFMLLPIAIAYDRVPEERTFERELMGDGKGSLRLVDFLRWSARLLGGKVQLGRVHIRCGNPVWMTKDADVRSTAERIMHELRSAMPVSTFHLREYLGDRAGEEEIAALKAALIRRGACVVDSSLETDITPVIRQTLANQWRYLLELPEACSRT
jgi:glycerol-3-phosphate O-acyltransferase